MALQTSLDGCKGDREHDARQARHRDRADGRGRITIYLSISFLKSIPPHNRQLDTLIRSSSQQVDDFVGELTF